VGVQPLDLMWAVTLRRRLEKLIALYKIWILFFPEAGRKYHTRNNVSTDTKS